MSEKQDFSDIGEKIKNAVQDAVESGNFGQMNYVVKDTIDCAMDEVRRLSLLAGIGLTEADIQYWMDNLAVLGPECKPSMRQDAEAHRPTELALFAKTVRALGREYGMATPVNDFLYDRITAIEAAYSEEKGRKNG